MGKKVKCTGLISDTDWQVRDAFSTLCRAKEIEKDKPLMAKVRAYAQQQLEQSANIISESKED